MLAEYYQHLKKFIEFETISVDWKHCEQMVDCANWLNHFLSKWNMETQVFTDYGNPIVVASYEVNKNLPTCLIYGHYDVQLIDRSKWRKNDPFSLYIWKDKIFARGVVDNKWQVLIHILTVLDLIEKQQLWFNIKFLLEGGKKIWSVWLSKFLDENSEFLDADFSLISGGEIIGDSPCVEAWFRWWFNVKLSMKTASIDFHSGLYGWVVPNALHEMTKLLSKIYDRGNHITIPYFYYDVDSPSIDENMSLKDKCKIFDQEKFMKTHWVKQILKEKDFSFFEQIWLRPTIQVTGISSWYTWDWFKNAIPSNSVSHLNFRLVWNQQVQNVIKAFKQWLVSNIPDYVSYDMIVEDLHEAIKIDIYNPYVEKVKHILKHVYWKDLIYSYSWWWSPVVKYFTDILWITNILVPFANDDCNMHSVNENFDISLIQKAFDFSKIFLGK